MSAPTITDATTETDPALELPLEPTTETPEPAAEATEQAVEPVVEPVDVTAQRDADQDGLEQLADALTEARQTRKLTDGDGEGDGLSVAQRALLATLAQAKAARRNARFKDLTAEKVEVPAPYAKEWRLILGSVAQRLNVFAVGSPRGERGRYRSGYDVVLFGFKPDIKQVLDTWDAVRSVAAAGMTAAAPLDGEDTGTFRSSWLLGFQLGLTEWADTDREAIEARISGPIVADPTNVRMRSTGSGAYAGFTAARELVAAAGA